MSQYSLGKTDLKTSKEWFKAFEHRMTILDFDGWNRDPDEFNYSWEQELISEKEFNRRLCSSTIIWDTTKL